MDVKVAIRRLRLGYGKKEVLKGINLDIVKNRIYGFMGPSASGKSTLISVINKMVSFEDGVSMSGSVLLDGEDIINGNIDEVTLRKRIGTVFATPIPLPRSIFENVAFGPKLNKGYSRVALNALVEESLQKAFLPASQWMSKICETR